MPATPLALVGNGTWATPCFGPRLSGYEEFFTVSCRRQLTTSPTADLRGRPDLWINEEPHTEDGYSSPIC